MTALPETCAPLYASEWSEVFARTLRPTCGQAGTACHAPQGAKGGWVVDDPAATHARLLGTNGGRQYIKPGDPACSLLITRLEAPASRVMPPGMRLSEPERCAITQWIRKGAAP